MALVIAADNQLLEYAPLSHGQTLAIIQQLEAAVCSLQEQFENLRKESWQSDVKLVELHSSVLSQDAVISGFQDCLNGFSTSVDFVKEEIKRIGGKVVKIDNQIEASGEQLRQQKDATRCLAEKVENQKKEIHTVVRTTRNLEESLENTNQAGRSTAEDLQHALHALDMIRHDCNCNRAYIIEQKTSLAKAHDFLQEHKTSIKESGARATLGETKILELQHKLKTTRSEMGDISSFSQHVYDELKQTQATVSNNAEAGKKNNSVYKRLAAKLDDTDEKLNGNIEKLLVTCANLGQTQDQLDKTSAHVRSMAEIQDVLGSTSASLQVQLNSTTSTVQAMKETLRMTNSIVLPNLQIPGNLPWSLRGGSSTRTPRKNMPTALSPGSSRTPPKDVTLVALSTSGRSDHSVVSEHVSQ